MTTKTRWATGDRAKSKGQGDAGPARRSLRTSTSVARAGVCRGPPFSRITTLASPSGEGKDEPASFGNTTGEAVGVLLRDRPSPVRYRAAMWRQCTSPRFVVFLLPDGQNRRCLKNGRDPASELLDRLGDPGHECQFRFGRLDRKRRPVGQRVQRPAKADLVRRRPVRVGRVRWSAADHGRRRDSRRRRPFVPVLTRISDGYAGLTFAAAPGSVCVTSRYGGLAVNLTDGTGP
jgi:hypothetical protein